VVKLMEQEREQKLNRQSRIKNTILLHTVRDILIENGLTTYEEFYDKYHDKLEKTTVISDDEKENLRITYK
jgi:hypothetical protein